MGNSDEKHTKERGWLDIWVDSAEVVKRSIPLRHMKRILHLVPVKNIIFKSSYNWFKIDICICLKLSRSKWKHNVFCAKGSHHVRKVQFLDALASLKTMLDIE